MVPAKVLSMSPAAISSASVSEPVMSIMVSDVKAWTSIFKYGSDVSAAFLLLVQTLT